jgi:hypothetical protein
LLVASTKKRPNYFDKKKLNNVLEFFKYMFSEYGIRFVSTLSICFVSTRFINVPSAAIPIGKKYSNLKKCDKYGWFTQGLLHAGFLRTKKMVEIINIETTAK